MIYRFIFLILCFGIIASKMFSQDNRYHGTITGIVIDKDTKQGLQGATIRILNTKYGAVSGQNGTFVIKNIPIGVYSVSAGMISYETNTIADIAVVTGRSTALSFELNLSAVETKEVSVTANYFSASKDDGLSSSVDISNKEIRTTPGAPDVFRRLQFMAGVGRASESTSALIVRGGAPEENLTVIENIEVFSPFHFSNLGGDAAGSLSIIEPKLIDNVNISTGGFTSQFGDKLSAISQMRLRNPSTDRFTGDLSVDFAGLSAFVSGPISENVSFMFAGRRGVLDWLMQMMDEKFIPVTTDFHTKCNIKLTDDHKLSIYGMYARDNMTGSHNTNEDKDKLIYSDITKNQSALGLTWDWLYSMNGYFKTTAYLNFNDYKLDTKYDYNKQDFFGQTNKQNFAGIKSDWFYRFSPVHKINAGADLKFINADYGSWSGYDTLSNSTVVQPYSIKWGPESSYKAAGYINYNYNPLDWLGLNAGLRGTYFAFTENTSIDPRISANITINSVLGLNLACGRYSQFPEFYKIFSDKENKNLKPAEALHFIAGIDYLLSEDMQLKMEVYHKNMSNLAVPLTDTGKVFKSCGSGYSTGIEVNFTKKMSDNFYLVANYTYSISKRKDILNPSYYSFEFDRPHALNLMLTYRYQDWLEFGLTAAYASGMPYTPYDLTTRRQIGGVWYCDEGAKNSARYPDYFRIDFRVERRFVFSSWNLRVFLDFWNITNHENIFEYSYKNGYKDRTGEVLFPFMPIFGIAAEL